MENKQGKKPLALNIVSGGVKHRGFGAGSLDLSSLSSVIIDGNEAYIDDGALHARSKVERGIRFSTNKDDVPNGRRCWVVWVSVQRNEKGKYYAGVTACEMLIDSEARRGWKILPDHVNKMEKALKQQIVLDGLNDTEKAALKRLLMEHNAEWWENSTEELKQAL